MPITKPVDALKFSLKRWLNQPTHVKTESPHPLVQNPQPKAIADGLTRARITIANGNQTENTASTNPAPEKHR